MCSALASPWGGDDSVSNCSQVSNGGSLCSVRPLQGQSASSLWGCKDQEEGGAGALASPSRLRLRVSQLPLGEFSQSPGASRREGGLLASGGILSGTCHPQNCQRNNVCSSRPLSLWRGGTTATGNPRQASSSAQEPVLPGSHLQHVRGRPVKGLEGTCRALTWGKTPHEVTDQSFENSPELTQM